MIGRVVLALVVVLLVVLGVVLYTGEWIREELDTGYSTAAQEDDLLAIRRFLALRGVRTRSLEVVGVGMPLPPREGVLLFVASRLALDDASARALEAWVRAGGHLITVPAEPADEILYGQRDTLLRGLGVTLAVPAASSPELAVPPPAGTTDDAADDPWFDDGCQVDPVLWARLDATRERLALSVPGSSRLEIAPSIAGRAASAGRILAEDGLGPFLYTAPLGRGRVTVAADPTPWSNTDVGCLDHAHLLWRLLGNAKDVWTVTQADRPTLFALLLREGVPLLVASAALLALWLWFAGARFGPPVPSPVPARRERAEAVRAAGEYLWRQRAVADLLAGLRARVRATARRRLGSEQAIEALATRARVPPALAASALEANPQHERDVIATTRTLKELIEKS